MLVPGGSLRQQSRGPLLYVTKLHWASRLHYDIRLEDGGMFRSWAACRAPSLAPGVIREATSVPLHELGGARFEGVFPPGRYGAGSVIAWDLGTYAPLDTGRLVMDRAAAEQCVLNGFQRGRITFFVYGHKVRGMWSMRRLTIRHGAEVWSLVKELDAFADRFRDLALEDRSVLSGRTIDEIRRGIPASKRDGSAPYQPPLPGLL